MLNLIFGPSGSGKTADILRSVREDVQKGIRSYLLVPEQQAYISERDFAALLPPQAGLCFEIVNFSGLAEDVFHAYGGVAKGSSDSGVRSVLMWDTLRSLAPLLRQYGKSAGDTTLSVQMLSAMEEFSNNGISAELLEDAGRKLKDQGPLRDKLADLALIDATFREASKEHFGLSVADRLLKAADLLETHSCFSESHIYIDSFTSFTAPEYAMIRQLLRQADSVTVTLCADRPYSRLMHFESQNRTFIRLEKLAKDVNCPVYQKILAPATEGKPKELLLLEQELWDFTLTKKTLKTPSPEAEPAVHTLVCSNLYEEAEACAIQILGLIQNGMHYGDVAVVVRDTEAYRGVLDAALERHGIPYFFSERTELATMPLSRLILSALRAVSRNFPLQDMITLVKTGLTGADLRDAALFEEYCETWHISGKRFSDEGWSMNPDGLTDRKTPRGNEILAAANRVRRILMEPLTALRAQLRSSSLLSDRCCAIYDYLTRLDISAQLSDYAKKELALGQRRQAGETLRLYEFITRTLTSLASLLPSSEVTVDEFLSVLTLCFATTDLGSVPNVHDCVMVGSAATLRVENVRASFLLGLCEGEFPQAASDGGILSDSEKEQLSGCGLTFDSRENIRFSEELFYLYRAMTKPKEQLFLSYPSLQPDGSAKTPSIAFHRIHFLFGRDPETFDSKRLSGDSSVESVPSLSYQAPPQPGGSTLRLSQSSLRTFVLCPYQYYSTYLLKIRSKKDSDVSAADEGSFLHFVFEQFLKRSLGEDSKLHLPPPEQLGELADAIIADYLAQVCPIPPSEMDSRLLHLFSRLRGLAILTLRDIVGELSVSLFEPVRFEQKIGGSQENALPLIHLSLKNGNSVELGGTVDRVDVYRKDGKFYIRIVDYKSSKHEFSLDDVRSGLDVQLVLYLFAVTRADTEKTVPCGVEYLYSSMDSGETKIARSGFLLDDSEIQHAADTSGSGRYTKKLLKQNAEEIQQITKEMQEVICSVAERILSGEAQKTPSENACKFCPVIDCCDAAYRSDGQK